MREKLYNFSPPELLTGLLYGEARLREGDISDDIREWLAIAWVVRNRVYSPVFPSSWVDVMLQPKQFSCFNEKDPNLPQIISFLERKNGYFWNKMYPVALSVYRGMSVDFSNGADHYVAVWLWFELSDAHWAKNMEIRALWGGHVFLRPKL